MKTREQLDADVIAAAGVEADRLEREAKSHGYGWLEYTQEKLIGEVRARRDAMRPPTKLMLLAAACWHGTSTPSDDQVKSSLAKYGQSETLHQVEQHLARILAAPDEPEGER